MKLLKIKLWNYKSIIEPIELDFQKSNHLIIIGKNGSGKTNLLKAIKLAVSQERYFYHNRSENVQAEYIFELSQDEIKNYFKLFENESITDNIITVRFDGSQPQKKTIKAPILTPLVLQYRENLSAILTDFDSVSKEYIDNLRKIESGDNCVDYVSINVKNLKGHISTIKKSQIDRLLQDLQWKKDEIEKVLKTFANDEFVLGESDMNVALHGLNYDLPFYEIQEEKLVISPIVAESLGLDAEKLKEANIKLNDKIRVINENLKDSYDRLTSILGVFNKLQKEISQVFATKEDEIWTAQHDLQEKQSKFIKELQQVVYANCYYIDNEDSLLFYSNRQRDYENRESRNWNLNSTNPILEAIDIFLNTKKAYREKESIFDYSKISSDRLNKIVNRINNKFLKQLVPNFDKGGVGRYELRIENKELKLFVIEKNGCEVDFNETSLGRRWYLTYKFITMLLKSGDYLLIDEPAAFLHPQAQYEIKKELEDISKKGIYVIYATHSPYLIHSDWSNIISVNCSEKGSIAKKFESGDDLCVEIQNELGDLRGSDILFNLSKTIILVEGNADKVCIKKFAELLQYNLQDYHIHVCDGEAILQVAYVCLTHKIIKVKVVLDNDNKYKKRFFVRGHTMYHQCIELLNSNLDKCVYIGEGEGGCLEDLFIEGNESKYKHYKNQKGQWKVDINAVKALTSIGDVSEQTRNNFEQLFKQLEIPKLDEAKD